MLLTLALYIPAAMAFWYAAPLAAWQNMPVGKALFYSFFAVWKSITAFIVYFMAWGFICLSAAMIAALLGGPTLSVLILAPLAVVLTLSGYCSFYPSYKSLFGSAPVEDVPPVM